MADEERLKHNFVLDFSEFLISYGYSTEDAMKTAKDFYEKNKGKLKETFF